MAELRLRTVTRTSGANAALKAGEVSADGVTFAFEEVPVLVHAFRRMVRELAYDVSEMALTTYLCAREHGVAFTALPVFLVRGLHHGAVVRNRRAGVDHPRDLEGRRVGVNRGYTVTTGVWARGVLQDEHGVDLARVTWVRSGDEHVAAYEPPPNVDSLPPGTDLSRLLVDGDLPAAVNVEVEHDDVVPLIAAPEEAAIAALRDRGFYPINHLIVVRDDVLRDRPEVAPAIFEAFAAAKRRYVDRLRAGAVTAPSAADRTYERVLAETGEDPLPYGVEPNRRMLETLVRYAFDQRILREPIGDVGALFAAGTEGLTA